MKLDTSKRVRERFEFIETRLFWGNGITAILISNIFGISRQAAQKTIDDYRSLFPGQIEYNGSRKRHEPTKSFEPHFIRLNPLYFLDYLRGQSLAEYYREESEWSDITVTDVDRLLRPEIPTQPIKKVLYGLLHQKVVSIDYHKKDLEKGGLTIRPISANHIVFADNRYHVRGYCHLKKAYRDFVLTRIVYAEILEGEEWVSTSEDKEWNEFIELKYKPNPELAESIRKSILQNYEYKESGIRRIRCRKAIAYYINKKLLAENNKYQKPLWILYSE
ncbi:MAG: WYL domain-containing protein [Gammaproteobacteria bacterium]